MAAVGRNEISSVGARASVRASEDGEASPSGPVGEVLILAAIERAELHDQADGVRRERIAEHLGLVPGAGTTIRLRPQIDALIDAGAVRQFRRHGCKVWGLAPKGRRRLARARRMGATVELPESPQHREWRFARMRAAGEIETLEMQLCAGMEQAMGLLAEQRYGSETWAALGESLRERCARLAAAYYCLHEWAEPEDSSSDLAARRRRLSAGYVGTQA